MATSYNANQYQNPFEANHLQNWQVPKSTKKDPKSLSGCTKIIATDRGHLTKDIPRSSGNPFGDFVGTWDLPKKIPGPRVTNPTARDKVAHNKLVAEKEDADYIIEGRKKALEAAKPDIMTTLKNKENLPGPKSPTPEIPISIEERNGSSGEIRSGAKCPTHDKDMQVSSPMINNISSPLPETDRRPGSHHSQHGIPHAIDDGICKIHSSSAKTRKSDLVSKQVHTGYTPPRKSMVSEVTQENKEVLQCTNEDKEKVVDNITGLSSPCQTYAQYTLKE